MATPFDEKGGIGTGQEEVTEEQQTRQQPNPGDGPEIVDFNEKGGLSQDGQAALHTPTGKRSHGENGVLEKRVTGSSAGSSTADLLRPSPKTTTTTAATPEKSGGNHGTSPPPPPPPPASEAPKKVRHNVTITQQRRRKKRLFRLGPRFFLLEWLYIWVFGLIHRCRKSKSFKKLHLRLIGPLTAHRNGSLLDASWEDEITKASIDGRPPKIINALRRQYGLKYFLIGIWKLVWAACTWAGAYYFLRVSIVFLETKNPNTTTGHLYAMALLLTSLGSSIAIHQLYGECTALGVQVKAAISVLVYRKALVLARIRGGAGEIINIMATDVARIVDAVTNFHFLWSAIVETVLILALAFPTVGWKAALVAVVLVVVILPVQILLGRWTSKIQIEQAAVTTERVHLMSEILTAIKLIKFYAWEAPFHARVHDVRARELALIRRNMQVKAINFAVVFVLPVLVALCSLSVYAATLNGNLESSVVFTALSIYNTLRYPLLMLPIAVKSASGARLALRRLDDYLTQPEVKPLPEHSASEGGDLAIDMEDGEFTWEEHDNDPALTGINFKAKKGQVIAIIGDVGAGKSSFIAALLGQMRYTGSSPNLKMYGNSSYVPQEAWLINVNLRENIVFGKPFDRKRYETVIKVCALERDLTLLSHGDMTEIGERGSNLSGGQKQRVSIARAVYHESDIVLMDDPLSALDQNVGRHIFDQCIRGFLSNRTVILVTHQLQYLHRCDHIVMLKSGRVAYQGTYDELMASQPEFSTLINTHVSDEDFEVAELPTESDVEIGPDMDLFNENVDDSSLTSDHYEILNQVTGGDPMLLRRAQLAATGIGARRHSLPPGTKVGDEPGTATIENRAYPTITPRERLELLQRHIPYLNHDSVLANTLQEHTNLSFINRSEHLGFSHTYNFDRAINRNELTIYSIPEGDIYAGRTSGQRRKSVQHRRSIIALDQAAHGGTQEWGSRRGSGDEDHHHEFDRGSDHSSDEDEDGEEIKKAGVLIGDDQSMNEFGFPDYVKYLRARQGITISLLLVAMFFFAHGIRIGSDYWLRLWVPDALNAPDSLYLGVYAGFIVAFGIAVLLRGLLFATMAAEKAMVLHDRAFAAVMRAPMSFFETTSLGRILSAFSKCMFTVDDSLPDSILQFLQYFPLALGAFLLIACVVHWTNAVAVIVLMLIAIGIVMYASPADLKLKQAEAITKPPVFQHITTTLEGLFSIRAYAVQKRFDSMNMNVLDKNHEGLYGMLMTKTWTAFWLDVISSLMVYSTALFLVVYRNDINDVSSVAGLALSNALQMLVFLQWTVRQMGDIQAQISNVGQLDYYAHISPEAPAEIPDAKPDKSWPQHGQIDFDNLLLKYRPDAPAVLKDVTFTIMPKEKVGIVGRTGSGKSTLLVGLLRIVEAAGGRILIDGVDISTLGLKDLRTQVGIIPQEPVLFVGTIRSNLDPFQEHDDQTIWRALDAVHLGEKVREMPSKLDTPVIEHGKNFSLGQRQLICIARALVIGSRIIVLDEATASIDPALDKMIQNTIKAEFKDCTVLTIAHRLNTIIESDKVLVMDGGVVAEFGDPHQLLQSKKGIFAELVSHAGEAASKKLAEMARESHIVRNAGVDTVKEEKEREQAAVTAATAAASGATSSGTATTSEDHGSLSVHPPIASSSKDHSPEPPSMGSDVGKSETEPTSPSVVKPEVEKQFQALFTDPAESSTPQPGTKESSNQL
ncbi:Multidrug resistance-associated protein 1 [Actinomortierella ambigua]|nr:Multidrug resistance-associated protein 1 [Actinomortierella ambigua]